MIVKFFKRGTGSCLATMNYLLGKNYDREHAKVLQGNPKLTQQLADSLDFKHRYTVGVLSFEESDLDECQKREIMADFEKALLCGLEQDQYNICWVEHKDKGRLELNFVIPKVELTTGKALNPYFDSVDRKRVNAFKDHTNAKYNLTDPNDPANRQPLTPKYNLPKDKKALQEAITGYLMNEMGQGRVIDRQSVLNAIQSDLGLSVARITPDSISIKDPTNENGRNIRLKGEIYADNFRFSQDYSAENERAGREYRANRTERISETGKILTAEIERKRAFNSELYSRPPSEPTSEIEHRPSVQELANDNHRGVIGDNPSIGRNGNVFLQQYERQPSRTSRNFGDHRANAPTAQSVEPIQHTAGREVLLPSDQEQESGSIRQQKRRKDDKNTQINAIGEPTSPTKEQNDVPLPPTPQNRSMTLLDPLNAIYPKRQEFLTNAQQLFERLQRIVERTRTAVKRVCEYYKITKENDRAINERKPGLQGVLRKLNRQITVHNEQCSQSRSTIYGFDNEIKQREQHIIQTEQAINRATFEQQEELDRNRGFRLEL